MLKPLQSICDTPCHCHLRVTRSGTLLNGLWRPHARHLASSSSHAYAGGTPKLHKRANTQKCCGTRKKTAKVDAADRDEHSDAHEQDHPGSDEQNSVHPSPPPRSVDAAIASLALPVRVQAPTAITMPRFAAVHEDHDMHTAGAGDPCRRPSGITGEYSLHWAFWWAATTSGTAACLTLLLLGQPAQLTTDVCMHAGSTQLAAVGVGLSIFSTVTKLLNIPLLSVTTNVVATAVGSDTGPPSGLAIQNVSKMDSMHRISLIFGNGLCQARIHRGSGLLHQHRFSLLSLSAWLRCGPPDC